MQRTYLRNHLLRPLFLLHCVYQRFAAITAQNCIASACSTRRASRSFALSVQIHHHSANKFSVSNNVPQQPTSTGRGCLINDSPSPAKHLYYDSKQYPQHFCIHENNWTNPLKTATPRSSRNRTATTRWYISFFSIFLSLLWSVFLYGSVLYFYMFFFYFCCCGYSIVY